MLRDKLFHFIIRVYFSFMVYFCMSILIITMLCTRVLELWHRLWRQRFHPVFRRSYYWHREFAVVARRNWFQMPFTISHMKRKFVFGFPLFFSRSIAAALMFFNPFVRLGLLLLRTILVVRTEIVSPFLFRVVVYLRIVSKNISIRRKSRVTQGSLNLLFIFFITIIFALLFSYVLDVLEILISYGLITLKVSAVGCQLLVILYVYWFFVFCMGATYGVTEVLFLSRLFMFFETRYYYAFGFSGYKDKYAIKSGLNLDPRPFFSSMPAQYVSDFYYVLGGFYKALNFDLYLVEKEDFLNQFIRLFGKQAARRLETFHYVFDGVDLHVSSRDSVWLLSSSMQYPSPITDQLPIFLQRNYTKRLGRFTNRNIFTAIIMEYYSDSVLGYTEQLISQSDLVNFSSAENFGAYPDMYRTRHDARWEAQSEFRHTSRESDQELFSWQHPYLMVKETTRGLDRLHLLVGLAKFNEIKDIRAVGAKRYLLEKPRELIYPFEDTIWRTRFMWSRFWKSYDLELHTSVYRLGALDTFGIPRTLSHVSNKGGMNGLVEWHNIWVNRFKDHTFAIKEPQDIYLRTLYQDNDAFGGWWFLTRRDVINEQLFARRSHDREAWWETYSYYSRRSRRHHHSGMYPGIFYINLQHLMLMLMFYALTYLDDLLAATLYSHTYIIKRLKRKILLKRQHQKKKAIYEDYFYTVDPDILSQVMPNGDIVKEPEWWNVIELRWRLPGPVGRLNKQRGAMYSNFSPSVFPSEEWTSEGLDVFYIHSLHDLYTSNIIDLNIFNQVSVLQPIMRVASGYDMPYRIGLLGAKIGSENGTAMRIFQVLQESWSFL